VSAAFVTLCSVLLTQPPVFPRYELPLSHYVTLTMTTDRATYYVREPLTLRLTVRNVHADPVHGYFVIDPDGPLVEISYRRGASEFVKLERGRSYGDYVHRPQTLQPREEISAQGVVAFDHGRRRFFLDQPGIYEVKVIYRDVRNSANAVLESGTESIKVVPPSAGHRQAQELYSTELALLAEYEPAVSYAAPEQIKAAVQFLDRFPDSPYSPTLRDGVRESLRQRVSRQLATAEERELYERVRVQAPPRR